MQPQSPADGTTSPELVPGDARPLARATRPGRPSPPPRELRSRRGLAPARYNDGTQRRRSSAAVAAARAAAAVAAATTTTSTTGPRTRRKLGRSAAGATPPDVAGRRPPPAEEGSETADDNDGHDGPDHGGNDADDFTEGDADEPESHDGASASDDSPRSAAASPLPDPADGGLSDLASDCPCPHFAPVLAKTRSWLRQMNARVELLSPTCQDCKTAESIEVCLGCGARRCGVDMANHRLDHADVEFAAAARRLTVAQNRQAARAATTATGSASGRWSDKGAGAVAAAAAARSSQRIAELERRLHEHSLFFSLATRYISCLACNVTMHISPEVLRSTMVPLPASVEVDRPRQFAIAAARQATVLPLKQLFDLMDDVAHSRRQNEREFRPLAASRSRSVRLIDPPSQPHRPAEAPGSSGEAAPMPSDGDTNAPDHQVPPPPDSLHEIRTLPIDTAHMVHLVGFEADPGAGSGSEAGPAAAASMSERSPSPEAPIDAQDPEEDYHHRRRSRHSHHHHHHHHFHRYSSSADDDDHEEDEEDGTDHEYQDTSDDEDSDADYSDGPRGRRRRYKRARTAGQGHAHAASSRQTATGRGRRLSASPCPVDAHAASGPALFNPAFTVVAPLDEPPAGAVLAPSPDFLSPLGAAFVEVLDRCRASSAAMSAPSAEAPAPAGGQTDGSPSEADLLPPRRGLSRASRHAGQAPLPPLPPMLTGADRRPTAALRNLGSTCYLAASIQALVSAPPFRDFMLFHFVPASQLGLTAASGPGLNFPGPWVLLADEQQDDPAIMADVLAWSRMTDLPVGGPAGPAGGACQRLALLQGLKTRALAWANLIWAGPDGAATATSAAAAAAAATTTPVADADDTIRHPGLLAFEDAVRRNPALVLPAQMADIGGGDGIGPPRRSRAGASSRPPRAGTLGSDPPASGWSIATELHALLRHMHSRQGATLSPGRLIRSLAVNLPSFGLGELLPPLEQLGLWSGPGRGIVAARAAGNGPCAGAADLRPAACLPHPAAPLPPAEQQASPSASVGPNHQPLSSGLPQHPGDAPARTRVSLSRSPSFNFDDLLTSVSQWHDQQHDAHEFIRCMLQALHSEMANIRPLPSSVVSPSSPLSAAASPGAGPTMAADPAGRPGDCSPVSGLFGGRLLSRLCCLQCGRVSERVEPFLDLSVDIPPASECADPHRVTLEDCLRYYSRVEALDQQEWPKCASAECDGQRAPASKQIVILHWPSILLVHIKRFVWQQANVDLVSSQGVASDAAGRCPSGARTAAQTASSSSLSHSKSQGPAVAVAAATAAASAPAAAAAGRRLKLSTHIAFPLTGLRPGHGASAAHASSSTPSPSGTPPASSSSFLSQAGPALTAFLAGESAPAPISAPEYHLTAVVAHLGTSAEKGHYIADVRASVDSPNGWFTYDDARVSRVTPEGVARRQAYLLVYCLSPSPAP
ncbi:hypothetical protein H696_01573 [Fonticula alba]|uniref:USP domain-containing protein n=1 Tax=Fonticula alba TaxID=691883 RepID=A0A058ZDZ1_FONAL|nr:hypothetical protein H696_01573 [Fonticula alba]KCV72171.1 hypothetical protein H696_01573 [Fonticula alba]|eukprot:XP_009493749.1 hypothetical protein H696_01573 [Fonticula alba]